MSQSLSSEKPVQIKIPGRQ